MKSVLLEFLSTDVKTVIFVVRQDWEEKGIKDNEPLVFEADFSEHDAMICVKQIRKLYDEWRKYGYDRDYLNKQIDLEKRTAFYEIGEKIFSDALMKAIEGYDLIYFVPFSALHHLPLHAMRYKGKEIIDSFACSYLPSASVLQFINQDKSRPKEFNIKGIGVDFTNVAGVFAEEIKILLEEEYFHKKIAFLDKEATKESFFKDNTHYNILHCSTHGYASKENPLKSAIILYMPKEVRDILKKTKDDEEYYKKFENDPRVQECCVTVEDLINRLNTPFDLIFMSACVTGESKNEAGDELIGLSRGVFYSGTKAMIMTLFNVDKNVTSHKFSNVKIKMFYENWIEKKQPKARALQNYIKIIKEKEELRHPFFWFAYILIGNPY